MERIPLNIQLSPILIKHILSQEITLDDLKYHDNELFKQLSYILNNSIDEFMGDVNFIYVNEKKQQIELVENGKNIYLND